MTFLEQLAQYVVSGITVGSIFGLVGLGFTIVFSVTGIINFAQGEFVMLGGMLSVWLLSSVGIPLAAAFILAIAITTLVGLLVERLAIRPARNSSVISLIVITIGVSIFLRGVAGQLWGKNAVALPAFSGEEPIPFLGALIPPQSLWILGTTLVVMALLHLFLTRTMMGKALRATAINRRAAGLMGVDVSIMSLIAFSLSAAVGAIGGIVFAPLVVSYDKGLQWGFWGFFAAALSGFSSQIGAVAGGILVGVLRALLAGLVSSAYADAITMAILLLVLLARSQWVKRRGGSL